MFTTLALLALTGAAQALTVATPPSVVQCQPIKLSWAEGTAPYYLSVIPAGQASAAPLVSFEKMDATSYTWIVNLPANTGITIQVVDSTGTPAFSSPVSIMAGETDCMNASASDTAEASTETDAEASPSPDSASSPASTPASSASVSKPASSAAAASASASTTNSGAGRVAVGGAVAAFAGLLALAAF